MGNGSHLSVSVYHLYCTFSFSKKKNIYIYIYCTIHALNIENVDIQYEIIDVCTKCKLTIFLKKKKKKSVY